MLIQSVCRLISASLCFRNACRLYISGPNEEYPRSLNSLSFVWHAPSDYFQVKTYPQSMTTDNKRSFKYVWSQICDNNNNENDCTSTPTPSAKRRRFA